MATNGFGNGPDALLNDPGDADMLEKYNRALGDAIALRVALRILLTSGALGRGDAEQVAETLRECKAHFKHEWIASGGEIQPPWTVARYHSFAETMEEVINGLLAIGRR